MKSIFENSTDPLFERASRANEAGNPNVGQTIKIRSEFHQVVGNTSPHRIYVEAIPLGNKVLITVAGYQLAPNTNLPNITASDFVEADEKLKGYLDKKAKRNKG